MAIKKPTAKKDAAETPKSGKFPWGSKSSQYQPVKKVTLIETLEVTHVVDIPSIDVGNEIEVATKEVDFRHDKMKADCVRVVKRKFFVQDIEEKKDEPKTPKKKAAAKSPKDKAKSLWKKGETKEEIAEEIGRSISTVEKYIREFQKEGK